MADEGPARWRVHPDPEPTKPPGDVRGTARGLGAMLAAVCGPMVAAAGLVVLLSSDVGGLSLVPVLLTIAGAMITVLGTRTMLRDARRDTSDRRPGGDAGPG